MRILSVLILFIGFILIDISPVFAQKNKQGERSPIQNLTYENKVYISNVKTVKFHPVEDEKSIPIFYLGKTEVLELSFDDLRGGFRNYYFSIEHCTSNWKSSSLSPLEYTERFNEDRITQFESAHNTRQNYTHYRTKFPTQNTKPTRSGNYLLKIYEDADKRRLIITQKFYVISSVPQNQLQITTQFLPSLINQQKNQKINLQITSSTLNFYNPVQELQIHVKQNNQDDVMEILREPSDIQVQKLAYNLPKTLDFPGGNEFRLIDLRSFKLASERVKNLQIQDSILINLTVDSDRSNSSYSELFDENGRFYIRNMDVQIQEEQADYATVHFSYKTQEGTPLGENQRIFVVGQFNQYNLSPEFEMVWNEKIKQYDLPLKLKQGVYNYQYKVVDRNLNPSKNNAEGDFFQTENEYHIFVYYKKPGTTWEELIGYQVTHSR